MLASFGGGAAYYFMPLNLYLAGALLGTQWELHQRNEKIPPSPRSGLGSPRCSARSGGSRRTGPRVAGKVMGASMKDELSQRWSALTFALLFSSTYN